MQTYVEQYRSPITFIEIAAVGLIVARDALGDLVKGSGGEKIVIAALVGAPSSGATPRSPPAPPARAANSRRLRPRRGRM
jgi:hypothetical protein